MKKSASVVLAVLASVALALSGCSFGGTADKRPTTGASPAPSPGVLAATIADLSSTSHRFRVVANEGEYVGGIDPEADTLDAAVSVSSQGTSLKIETRGVGGAYFARFTGPPVPGVDGATWYKVDPAGSRRPGALGISAEQDPTGVRALVAAVRTVAPAGDRLYRGTVDLTRVAAWGPVNVAQVAQVGAAAKEAPFEAAVDERGRLVSLRVDVPGSGPIRANTVTATYTDYGSPVTVTPPATSEPLPSHLYAILGLT